MKTARFMVVLVVIAALVAIMGCQPAATPAPAAPAATQPVAAAPAATSAPKTIVIGYSPPTLEMTDFYKFGQQGLEKKAKELGLNIQVITKAPSTHAAAEEQLRIVEDFITQKVDYIWIVPVSVEAGPPMFDAAFKAGIPMFVGHALYDDPAALHIINVGTDFLKTGLDVGNWIAADLNCTGPVGIIRGAAGQYDSWRVESAKVALAAKCPNVVVYSSDYTDWVTEKGMNAAATMLKAHPDIKLIYNPSSTLTLGTVQAVEAAGLTAKVQVLDYDFIPAVQKMCPEKKVVAGLAMFPYKYGYVVAQLIADKEAGKTIPVKTEVPGVVVACDKLSTTFEQWYLDLAI
jgi:ABC-type sugar transport system substrate-binding protein